MALWSRRRFFLTTLAGSFAASARKLFAADAPNGNGVSTLAQTAASPAKGTRPLLIASSDGLNALDLGMGLLKRGHDTLDAVLAVVNVVEDDPGDNSVGYGGLPNEEGDVELDASVMHGPSRRAGSVASLRYIKNPSKVARLIMEQTDHVMLVGPGALRFAEMQGFERMNLLTTESRIA